MPSSGDHSGSPLESQDADLVVADMGVPLIGFTQVVKNAVAGRSNMWPLWLSDVRRVRCRRGSAGDLDGSLDAVLGLILGIVAWLLASGFLGYSLRVGRSA